MTEGGKEGERESKEVVNETEDNFCYIPTVTSQHTAKQTVHYCRGGHLLWAIWRTTYSSKLCRKTYPFTIMLWSSDSWHSLEELVT